MKRPVISLIVILSCLVNLWPTMQVRAAVTVVDFIVSPMGTSILIEWWTEDETDNTGFYLQRSLIEAIGYQRISNFILTDWDTIQTAYYYYFDEEVLQAVIYYYRLEFVDRQGALTFSGPVPGSTIQMLPTFTPQSSPVPTSTSTPASTAPINPTSTNTAAARSTSLTTTPVTLNSTSLTPTITGNAVTQTVTPEMTGTILPSITATLEPLPTIVLTFPPTPTYELVTSDVKQDFLLTATPTQVPTFSLFQKLPTQLVPLGVIVLFIWVCLGAFLVFIVYYFRD